MRRLLRARIPEIIAARLAKPRIRRHGQHCLWAGRLPILVPIYWTAQAATTAICA